MADDQSEVIRFLMDPATHGGAVPEHVETHGAHVFLAGDVALKIKRAAKYDYMDFSTLALRERMIRRELELNRPAAPMIYRDVLPVTREDGRLALGGSGEPVEWALRMWRFPQENELSEVAARGELDDRLAEDLGQRIADYHARAPLRTADGAALIAAILDELDTAFATMVDDLGGKRLSEFRGAARAALEAVTPLLAARGAGGHVRRCHGDLHLGNIVLNDGRPVLYDALEFDEELGTCDVLYDLAFLIMDLRHRGLARAANLTLNAWLFAWDGAEDAGLAALPLFLAVRAAIRAMVEVQTDMAAGHPGQCRADARAYLDEALAVLSPARPRLVAVGGVSGSGKTTLGRRLAPEIGAAPGAVHLRSDLERKRLAGVDPTARLPAEAYGAAAGDAVYARLLERAETLLEAGRSVLLDATWLSPERRAGAEALARRAGVPFIGLWLEAPETILKARVTRRQGDASDADAVVVSRQLQGAAGAAGWLRIDAAGPPETTLASALAALAE
jgi:aminoglycoside phosphotransferase family enzyme/predicted kinase